MTNTAFFLATRYFFITFVLYVVLAAFISSCDHDSPISHSTWQTFDSRDNGNGNGNSIIKHPVYRAKVPAHWIRKDPAFEESIVDTTKANCEFVIQENGHTIRITFHTFPIESQGMRIPAQAQIVRWKRQFDELDPPSLHTQSEGHGGFTGLFFEGQGSVKTTLISVLGWSMQLADIYVRQLKHDAGGSKNHLSYHRCADYTIKASGPTVLINKYRNEIIDFASSLELIDELKL